MQTYLVGGAVRDRLLGLPVRERDWVVVGATPADMEARGFRRVGRSFPVYLHPDTGEEYALARTERKTAPGYHGFEVVADPTVTLEQDLHRRDLTINAMAEDLSGRIIDPWGGQEHLRSRVLHHVSAAFAEDPVRILRVARFAARFHALDFTVAPATLELMTGMVRAGETGALQSERVWQETEKALGESRPDTYFRVLRDCGALATVFPELDALFGVPQPPRWHPEIDTGIHILMAVREAARRGYDTAVRFAVLVHDLGKGTTPPGEWPKHRGHEQRSAVLVRQLCTRLSVPNRFRDLAIPVALHHGLCHRAFELRPQTILHLLEDVDAFRRPERLEAFLDACECDARGRTGLEDQAYPQRELLRSAFEAAREVDAAGIAAGGLAGEQLREAIRAARRAAISELRQRFPPAPEAVTARPADPG